MSLKPQDFLVSLKLLVLQHQGTFCTYPGLAEACGLSASDGHGAVKRASASRLLVKTYGETPQSGGIQGYRAVGPALTEFGLHGLKFVWPAGESTVTVGMATGLSVTGAALGLVDHGQVRVWPTPDGQVRGLAIQPWHPSLPQAGARDATLLELLALLEVIRGEGARARGLASHAFSKKIAALAQRPSVLPLAVSS
jgi:hypothetical protein